MIKTLIFHVAGLPNARSIEYVRIGDISSPVDVDAKRVINLADVTIHIGFFDFVESDDAEWAGQPDEPLGNEQNEGTAQAKIIRLPSRKLRRAWDSYASTPIL